MLKPLLLALTGSAIIIVCAIAWLVFTPLAHAKAATCHGQSGIASWYGSESGHRTANGEYFDGSSMTMAVPIRSMMGKIYRVTDMRTGRSVMLRANDYGPAKRLHRVADLSRAAAVRLGIVERGTARVCLLPESGASIR